MEEVKNRGQLVQKFWRNAKGMVVVVSIIGVWLEKKNVLCQATTFASFHVNRYGFSWVKYQEILDLLLLPDIVQFFSHIRPLPLMAAGLTPRAIDASTRLLTVLNLKYRPFAYSLKIIRVNYYQLMLCTTIVMYYIFGSIFCQKSSFFQCLKIIIFLLEELFLYYI